MYQSCVRSAILCGNACLNENDMVVLRRSNDKSKCVDLSYLRKEAKNLRVCWVGKMLWMIWPGLVENDDVGMF